MAERIGLHRLSSRINVGYIEGRIIFWKMELIETNFDKTHISQCAYRCFQAYHRPHLSPEESHCLQQYLRPYSDVLRPFLKIKKDC